MLTAVAIVVDKVLAGVVRFTAVLDIVGSSVVSPMLILVPGELAVVVDDLHSEPLVE